MLHSLVVFIASLLGFITSILLYIFVVFAVLFKVREKKFSNSKSKIALYNMPLIRPIPISTHEFKGLDKFLVLIFSSRRWRIEDAFSFKFQNEEYLIPAGFEFSGRSIPRPLWGIFSSSGVLLIPALIHEYGYRYNGIYCIGDQDQPILSHQNKTKEFWDDLFSSIEIDINDIELLSTLVKFCVRKGGKKTWKSFRTKSEVALQFKWSLEPFEVNNELYVIENEPLSEDNPLSKDEQIVEDDQVAEDDQVVEDDQVIEDEPAPEDAQVSEDEPFIDNEVFVSGKTNTRTIGYENSNRQKVLGTRGVVGSDPKQTTYKMECLVCHEFYGSNVSEIYRRKCPKCQNGNVGTPY